MIILNKYIVCWCSPAMADQSSILALIILAVGVTVHFSLHKVEEGHVGVYYRVSISQGNEIYIFPTSYLLKLMLSTGTYRGSYRTVHLF